VDGFVGIREDTNVNWLAAKYNETCHCKSGLPYKTCCFRRELVYFMIAALVALILFFVPRFW
jgi:hypothetical protein